MFGYVRAYRPRLMVCELDLYKSVYCGPCRTLRAKSGYASSLTLSYDLVFLTLMKLGADGGSIRVGKRRCPLHPIRKTLCASCRGTGALDAFEYAADCSVILTYHKLADDLADSGLKKKLAAAVLMPFYAAPYKKTAARRKYLSDEVERAMKLQKRLEKSGEPSIDRAAEPTASIMRAVFAELGGVDPDLRNDFSRFGYFLGRYVYFCDALDDVYDDYKSGGYNPLISQRARARRADTDTLIDEDAAAAVRLAKNAVYLTLGAMAQPYDRLPLGEIRRITDNVVYLGLKAAFSETVKKTEDVIKGKGSGK